MTLETPRFTKTEFRQIKYILYFVVFIVIFQVFQYVTTKRATHRYREHFGQATEIVILTNSVAFEIANIHRAILNLSFTADSSEVRQFRDKLSRSEKVLDEKMALIEDKIVSHNLYTQEKTLFFAELKQATEVYHRKYRRYLSMLQTASTEGQLNFRRNVLRPALESCQERQDAFIVRVFSDERRSVERIASEADHTAFNLLIGGNILLIIVALLLAYIIFTERKQVV